MLNICILILYIYVVIDIGVRYCNSRFLISSLHFLREYTFTEYPLFSLVPIYVRWCSGLVSGSPCTYGGGTKRRLVTDLPYGEQLTFLFHQRRDGYGNGRTEGRVGGGEKEWESRGNGGIEISGRNGSAYFSGGYTSPIYVGSERGWWKGGCSSESNGDEEGVACCRKQIGRL